MPELHWRYGYIFSLVVMAITAGGLIWFVQRRGWLRLDEVRSPSEEQDDLPAKAR